MKNELKLHLLHECLNVAYKHDLPVTPKKLQDATEIVASKIQNMFVSELENNNNKLNGWRN